MVRTDGCTYGHVTTKTSRMHRLSNFLTHGAPLRARKESSATKAREYISLYNQIHSLYRAARFCTVNHLSGGGVNANHNATHSPSLARKKKTEDSRLLKNSERNCDDEWNFCREQEQTCFILARDKNKKDQKNLRRKLFDYFPKQSDHKQRTLKHRNKESR